MPRGDAGLLQVPRSLVLVLAWAQITLTAAASPVTCLSVTMLMQGLLMSPLFLGFTPPAAATAAVGGLIPWTQTTP
jgi:hypothetical protein